MAPDLIRPHIRRVEILFFRVKHHPMDCGFLIERGVLDILVQTTCRIHTENVQKASMVIEWVSIDAVWRLLGG